MITLFLTWLFFKIRNIVWVKKYSNKDIYKEIKKASKKNKIVSTLFKISIVLLILFGAYFSFGFVLLIFMVIFVFITLGGVAYVETGADPTFYNNSFSFSGAYFSLIQYIIFIPFILIILLLIRAIYFHILNYKALNNK